ncbi:MAG: hypothetical protein AAF125_22995, partial [Chloroflexota bacterium]
MDPKKQNQTRGEKTRRLTPREADVIASRQPLEIPMVGGALLLANHDVKLTFDVTSGTTLGRDYPGYMGYDHMDLSAFGA